MRDENVRMVRGKRVVTREIYVTAIAAIKCLLKRLSARVRPQRRCANNRARMRAYIYIWWHCPKDSHTYRRCKTPESRPASVSAGCNQAR